MTNGPDGSSAPDFLAKPFRAKIGVLIFLTGLYFLNFVARLILAPLMPNLAPSLGLTQGQAGSLFMMMSGGYFVTLTLSGFVAARLGHRRTIILSSMFTGGALLLTSFSWSGTAMQCGMVLVGAGTGLYFPSGMAFITALVQPGNWGKAIALHETGPNLSFILAPIVAEACLAWTSWRGVLGMVGGLTILATMIFIRFAPPSDLRGEPPNMGNIKTLLSMPAFWVMLFLISIALGAQIGLFAMLPLYLVTDRGLDRTWANTLVALSRISGLFMAVVAGWINDWLGARKTMVLFLVTAGLSTIPLGFASTAWLVPLLFLQPTLAAGFFPAGLAALSTIGPASVRNLTIALTIPMSIFIGTGAIPAALGVLGETGRFSLGIAIFGILITLAPMLVGIVRPYSTGSHRE